MQVLGLGDSNLLLDRQTTTAKDCNQIAQKLDRRLVQLGATRFYAYGEADDRTGNAEVAPWLDGLGAAVALQRKELGKAKGGGGRGGGGGGDDVGARAGECGNECSSSRWRRRRNEAEKRARARGARTLPRV